MGIVGSTFNLKNVFKRKNQVFDKNLGNILKILKNNLLWFLEKYSICDFYKNTCRENNFTKNTLSINTIKRTYNKRLENKLPPENYSMYSKRRISLTIFYQTS